MNERRFLNQSQPQTLVIATLLLYINAFFGLFSWLALHSLGIPVAIGLAVGGYGIANEKKWGYGIAVAAAVLQLALLLRWAGTAVFDFPFIITLLFDAALVALLVHPESRDYQRIWFK